MDFSITVEPPMPPLSPDSTACLAGVAAAGFTRTDWCWDWWGRPVFYDTAFMDLAAAAFAEHGLRLSSVHAYANTGAGMTFTRELFLAVNVNRIEFASRLGAGVLVVHLPLHDFPTQDQALAESLDVLERLRPAAQEAGVRVAAENLFSPRQHDQTAFFDTLFARFSPDYLGFCYDSGHASMTGCQDFVARYASRVICTHLHDNDGKNDQHLLPGAGVADWKMILGTLKRSGFAGPVNLEVRIPKEEPRGPFFLAAMAAIRGLWDRA